jgi:hypothetical protein
MGTVLIHAGMPKTGSTSIQEWLRRNAAALRSNHDTTVVRDRGGPFDRTKGLIAYERGPFVISNRLLISYYGGVDRDADPSVMRAVCDEIVEELDAAATAHGNIVITSEGFSRPIAESRPDFLAALEELTRRHTVRVVYYVRPQHEALESRWRQWGYDAGPKPAAWIAAQLDELHYGHRLVAAETAAPSVRFEVRPFRRDLLVGGDAVTDFAHVLDAPELVGEEIAANPGLSLDLSILLHGAPRHVTATPEHLRVNGIETGRRRLSLAVVTAGWDLPTSAQADQARAALHAVAHAEFADDNALLVERQGWATDAFVAPTNDPGDLASLDDLLSPSIDPTALAHLHNALADLCAAHEKESSR